MPLKCCVPACKSNYRGTPYVTSFRFPKNAEMRELWKRKIPRANFTPNNNSVVCVKHFSDAHVVTHDELPTDAGCIRIVRGKPRLTADAYPMIFPLLPSYLSENTSCRATNADLRAKALEERYERQYQNDLLTLKEKYAVKDFERLLTLLKEEEPCQNWISVSLQEKVEFYLMDRAVSPPKVAAFVEIDRYLLFTVFVDGVKIAHSTFKDFGCTCGKFSSWDEINNVLLFTKNMCTGTKHENLDVLLESIIQSLKKYQANAELGERELSSLPFLIEQLQLLRIPPNRYSYSSETLLFSYTLFMKSSTVYEYVRTSGILHLPHAQTLRKLSKSFLNSGDSNEDTIHYLKQKRSLLKENEALVNLLVDEIHIQPALQYKGGKIVGKSSNDSECLAQSVHVVMLSSILSTNKDVISFLPVRKLSGDALFEHVRDCIKAIENIGYKVLSIITDNNAINRKMFQLFAKNSVLQEPLAVHPFDCSRPLFLLYDSVHLLKCIRNNWLAQSSCFIIPTFPGRSETTTASFQHLVHVYNVERDLPIKYGYRLTESALNPSSIQKQKVNLALKIFDQSNISALRHLGPQKAECSQWNCWEGTASFISIIVDWWEIVNVKSCTKGYRKKNVNMMPINSLSSEQMQFLKLFLSWLEEWSQTVLGKERGGLSKETSNALIHTVKTTIHLITFLLNECDLKFVLLGKFQTDKLEARFGQYRQLSGSNYHVSLQQLYESEKKLKISSLLRLKSSAFGSITVQYLAAYFDSDSSPDLSHADKAFVNACVLDDVDLDFTDDEVNNLVYIVGYSCFKFSQKNHCKNCISVMCTSIAMDLENIALINECNRGGLTYPTKIAVNAGLIAYAAFTRMISKTMEQQFLKCKNQLATYIEIVMILLQDDELIALTDFHCECGNLLKDLLKKVIVTCGNIFLKNYASKFNIKPSCKRKLATFAGI